MSEIIKEEVKTARDVWAEELSNLNDRINALPPESWDGGRAIDLQREYDSLIISEPVHVATRTAGWNDRREIFKCQYGYKMEMYNKENELLEVRDIKEAYAKFCISGDEL